MTRAEAIEAAALRVIATLDGARLAKIDHPLSHGESRLLKSAKRTARLALRKALAMPKDVRTEWSETAQGFVAAHAPEPEQTKRADTPPTIVVYSGMDGLALKIDIHNVAQFADAPNGRTLLYAHPPADTVAAARALLVAHGAGKLPGATAAAIRAAQDTLSADWAAQESDDGGFVCYRPRQKGTKP